MCSSSNCSRAVQTCVSLLSHTGVSQKCHLLTAVKSRVGCMPTGFHEPDRRLHEDLFSPTDESDTLEHQIIGEAEAREATWGENGKKGGQK